MLEKISVLLFNFALLNIVFIYKPSGAAWSIGLLCARSGYFSRRKSHQGQRESEQRSDYNSCTAREGMQKLLRDELKVLNVGLMIFYRDKFLIMCP